MVCIYGEKTLLFQLNGRIPRGDHLNKDFNVQKTRLVPCEKDDYDAMLDLLDICFRTPSRHWFGSHMSHIFKDEPTLMGRHFLMKDGNSIAGIIGIYPFVLFLGGIKLNTAGIGSVSVHPEYRSTGMMSAMLKQADVIMEDEGFELSWLSGDRFRYSNYGWEPSGRLIEFTVVRKDLERRFPSIKPEKCHTATFKDIPLLDGLYQTFKARCTRDTNLWTRHFSRDQMEFLISGNRSYCVINREHRDQVLEINGDPAEITKLLLATMARDGLDKLMVYYPDILDPVSSLLYACSMVFKMLDNRQLKIIDTDKVWEKLIPIATVENSHDPALSHIKEKPEKNILIRRLLGFFDSIPALTGPLVRFQDLRPLHWYLPFIDYV
jgi:predicted N-acetyltransferase YhbS